MERKFRIPPNEKCDFFFDAGIILYEFSYFHLALNLWNRSLECFAKCNSKDGEAACYGNIGIAYYGLGDFRKAIEYYNKSLRKAIEIGDKSIEANCYTNLGNAYYGLGDFRKAIEYHNKSLEIIDKTGDKNIEPKCYTNIGIAYYGLGDFRKAIEYYNKSLRKAIEIGDKSIKSACYTNLGNAYYGLGDFRKAIEYYRKSSRIARKIGDRSTESISCGNIGPAYLNLGKPRKAIEYCEKSLEIAREIKDKAEESIAYMNTGICYCDLRNYRKSIEFFEKSLKIEKEIGNRVGESNCYLNFGVVYYELGDTRKAIEYCEKSLEIARETNEMDLERNINLNLGLIYCESEPERAFNCYRKSTELSEMISDRLVEEQQKIGFSFRAFDAYQYIIPLCVMLNKRKEVFDYTERSKSRAFLDILAATEVMPAHDVTIELQSLLSDEEIYLGKLREIQTRHLRPIKTPVEPGEVEKIYENLTHIYTQIEQFDPEYVFIRRGKPLSLTKMQDLLFSQGKDVVLLEYFITEKKTYIFVISSRDHQFHIRTVPLPAKTFNQYLKDWKKIAFSSNFQKFSNYLIEPVSEYLNEGDLIYFVPYGPLHYFPLHALIINGEPLIRNHPVAYLPSASILPFCQNKGTHRLKTCTSFGIPFEEEAEKVADLFNTKAFTGSSATAENLETCTTDIIHLSCHALFDDKDPLSSRIQLHDKTLTARDIFTLRLTTELVTLSACETGYNERSPGDELIGLTRAFLYAGAPSVIVSLWPVYSPPTQKFMLEFYKQLKNGNDKATALQEAQIKIMEIKKYLHPYFWAPFMLVGNWK